MSLQNILIPNPNSLYCENITVTNDLTAGTFNVDNITIDGIVNYGASSVTTFELGAITSFNNTPSFHDAQINSTLVVANVEVESGITYDSISTSTYDSGSIINGFPNLSSTSVTNFSTGSIIEGNIKIGNSGAVTFNSGTSLITNNTPSFNNGVTLSSNPFNYLRNTYTIVVTYTGDNSTYNVMCNFFKIGQLVSVWIPKFPYTSMPVPVTGSGIFLLDISGFSNYLISTTNISNIIVPVVNAAGYVPGLITTNPLATTTPTTPAISAPAQCLILYSSITPLLFSSGYTGLVENVLISYIGN